VYIFVVMNAKQPKNPKILKRNEKIRKRFDQLTEIKHYSIDYSLTLLEEEFLPLSTTTIWLIISCTGFYKNY